MKNLINAIYQNDINLVKQLLDNITDINEMYDGYNALIRSAEKGQTELPPYFLKMGLILI